MHSSQDPIRITDPVELVSVIPYLVGFAPEQSLTITALRGPRVVAVARLDLPPAAGDEPWIASMRQVATTFARNHVQQTVLVAYGHGQPVTVAVEAATQELAGVSITVQDAYRVSSNRLWHQCHEPACPTQNIPMPAASVAAVRATVAGLAPAASRQALADRIGPVTGPARTQAAAATTAVCQNLAGLVEHSNDRQMVAQLVERSRAATGRARAQQRTGHPVDAATAAEVAVLLNLPEARDHAMASGRADDLPLWTDLVRRAQPGCVAGPALVLAVCALSGGDGILAGLAVDRALADQPDNRMAQLLRLALAAGMNPDELATMLRRPPSPSECQDGHIPNP